MWSVPTKAIADGPYVNWKHIDGPYVTWAGEGHWLTFSERFMLLFRLTTIDNVACKRWPYLKEQREAVTYRPGLNMMETRM